MAGARDEFQADGDRIYLNNRELRFNDTRPLRMNGTLYVPLRTVAQEATGTCDVTPARMTLW